MPKHVTINSLETDLPARLTEANLAARVAGAVDPIKASKAVDVEAYGAKGDGVTDDTAAIQAAIDQNTVGGDAQVVIRFRRGKNYLVSGTLTVNVKKATLEGYRSRITYTGAGVLFQLVGSANFSTHGTPVMRGMNLKGPGISTTSVAVKMNKDDAQTTGSYVAGQPFENCTIERFGTGILYNIRAWGNTFKSCLINQCGTGFLVPVGMDATMGERLAFDDVVIAECNVGAEVKSGSVELNFTNCSLDYNKIALKSTRNSHFVNCHLETRSGTQWTELAGHFQHMGAEAFTHFVGCTFVFSDIHTEIFEPYNAGTLSDIYMRTDRFVFDVSRWSLTWGATFTSRLTGFPHRRLVNEIAGNRNVKRGIFDHIISAGAIEPLFGGSLVPGRSHSGVALPTATIAANSGDAPTTVSVLDDLSGSKPESYRTITAAATAAGTANIDVKFKVPVGPSDYGKRLAVKQKADFNITGADAEFTVYASAVSADGVELMTMETWAGMTAVPTAAQKVELWKGYAIGNVPPGTAHILLHVQLRKTRAGDSWNVYPPLVNIV